MENNLPDMLAQAAAFMKEALDCKRPRLGLILGSGLGSVADQLTDAVTIPFESVPHMRSSTAHSHAGNFVCGTLEGACVLAMQGRVHEYEGYSPAEVAFPVWLMHCLGVETLINTNAVGAINESYEVNDLCITSDHINFSCGNPLANQGASQLHDRFTDMTNAYDPRLRRIALEAAGNLNLPAHESVFIAVKGPSLETPAEIRAFRTLGADTVGMSSAIEAIAARHVGLHLLGISYVMNMAAGITCGHTLGPDLETVTSQAASDMTRLLRELIPRL